MLRLEEARDAVVRFVVDEDGAEQSLFGLDVVGRGPKREGVGRASLACDLSGLAACGFDHGREVGGFAQARQCDSPAAGTEAPVFLVLHRRAPLCEQVQWRPSLSCRGRGRARKAACFTSGAQLAAAWAGTGSKQ